MASTIRRHLVDKLGPVFKTPTSQNVSAKEFLQRLAWCVRVPCPEKNEVCTSSVHIPFKLLRQAGIIPSVKLDNFHAWVSSLVQSTSCGSELQIAVKDNLIDIQLDKKYLIKTVLSDICTMCPLSGLCSDLVPFTLTRCKSELMRDKNPQNVVIEYSSPNIAKPFHAGHLRSTVQGNVLANIYQYLGHRVTRVNYLGDWGTQFGYIGVGLDKYSSQINPEDSAISQYYQVYVAANKASEDDPSVHDEAKNFFHRMEQGGDQELSVWRDCKEASVKEYQDTYKRLGVHFDVFEGESEYKDKALTVVEQLKQKGLVHKDPESGYVYTDVTPHGGEKSVKVKLLKSDGSTLYITRDIAAANERYEKYQFDRLLYVVDEGQNKHFQSLLSCLQSQGHDWAMRPWSDFHVGFGRVQGMSSRRGNVVFLKDILDEAKMAMLQSMREKHTTKLQDSVELERAADQLGVSAIVVQDLRLPRMKPYTFQWEKMLRFTGNTGVFIQYTHARLCSLERSCLDRDIDLDLYCDTAALIEPQALRLVLGLAGFDEAVYTAYSELQPYRIVQYLLEVCHLTGSAFHSLNVLDQPKHIAQARLLLFHSARLMIAEGLKLLSLTPLERM